MFSDSFPHAIFYKETTKQDSMNFYVFSKKKHKWNCIYQTKVERYYPAPIGNEFDFIQERNPKITDLKIPKTLSGIHNIQTFTYFAYYPEKDSLVNVIKYSEIANPKYENLKKEIHSIKSKGCANALKEYAVYFWESNNIFLKKKYEIDCCQKNGSCDIILTNFEKKRVETLKIKYQDLEKFLATI